MKLKDFKNNWIAVRLSDRAILRKDLPLMSAEQVESLMETTIVSNGGPGYFRAVPEKEERA